MSVCERLVEVSTFLDIPHWKHTVSSQASDLIQCSFSTELDTHPNIDSNSESLRPISILDLKQCSIRVSQFTSLLNVIRQMRETHPVNPSLVFHLDEAQQTIILGAKQ